MDVPKAYTRLVFPSDEFMTEQLPVETASVVIIELAWSDRPFRTEESLCSEDLAKAMIAIQRGIVSTRVYRR